MITTVNHSSLFITTDIACECRGVETFFMHAGVQGHLHNYSPLVTFTPSLILQDIVLNLSPYLYIGGNRKHKCQTDKAVL